MPRITDDHRGRAIKATLAHRERVARFDAKLRDSQAPIAECVDIVLETDDPESAAALRQSVMLRGGRRANAPRGARGGGVMGEALTTPPGPLDRCLITPPRSPDYRSRPGGAEALSSSRRSYCRSRGDWTCHTTLPQVHRGI